MTRRYALRDDQWERIKDLLPGRIAQQQQVIPHSALKVSHPDNFEVKQAIVPEASAGGKARAENAIDCQPVPTAFVKVVA